MTSEEEGEDTAQIRFIYNESNMAVEDDARDDG